jgi:hypothetical protein
MAKRKQATKPVDEALDALSAQPQAQDQAPAADATPDQAPGATTSADAASTTADPVADAAAQSAAEQGDPPADTIADPVVNVTDLDEDDREAIGDIKVNLDAEAVAKAMDAVDPRDMLRGAGFTHLPLRDGGGYQVFEKVSYAGMMIETVMVRADFRRVGDVKPSTSPAA